MVNASCVHCVVLLSVQPMWKWVKQIDYLDYDVVICFWIFCVYEIFCTNITYVITVESQCNAKIYWLNKTCEQEVENPKKMWIMWR